jgi:hypothetical protein
MYFNNMYVSQESQISQMSQMSHDMVFEVRVGAWEHSADNSYLAQTVCSVKKQFLWRACAMGREVHMSVR